MTRSSAAQFWVLIAWLGPAPHLGARHTPVAVASAESEAEGPAWEPRLADRVGAAGDGLGMGHPRAWDADRAGHPAAGGL